MKKELYIRADGSNEIGLGHLYRCISLASMLVSDFKITFYSKQCPGYLVSIILDNGWFFKDISTEKEFLDVLNERVLVIIDGYHFDESFQLDIKKKEARLMVVDDLQDHHFYADIVLNHAPGFKEIDYSAESHTQFLLGPKYALIRPEILDAIENRTLPKEIGQVEQVFICFGGSDQRNLTADTLRQFPKSDARIVAVTGPAYSFNDDMKAVLESRSDLDITWKTNLSSSKIKGEIIAADLAIVPTSGIFFEVVALRTPAIIGSYVENQLGFYKWSVQHNLGFGAGDFSKVGDVISSVLQSSTEELKAIVLKQAEIIDGQSPIRILNAVNKLYEKNYGF